jgi:hypothetical protein
MTTALTARGNLVLLPGVSEAARSVVAPRHPRSLWRRPWWWPARYRVTRVCSLRKRLDQLEAALVVMGVLPEPSAPRPSLWLVPGGGAA